MALDEHLEKHPQRVTIDLTPAARVEIERLSQIACMSTPDFFRTSMSLMRILIQAYEEGASVYYERPNGERIKIDKPY